MKPDEIDNGESMSAVSSFSVVVDCGILPKTDSEPLRIFIRDSVILNEREIKDEK